MTKLTINIGTVANDGTGDSIRGAFTNVNSNFTEVYNNVTSLAVTLTGAYGQANSANTLAYNSSVAANNWSNYYANLVGTSANSYSGAMANAGNSLATAIGTAGNTLSVLIGNSGNAVIALGLSSANAWSNNLATAGNNYVNTVTASDRAYTNASVAASNNWTTATFQTIANTNIINNTANQAYNLAITALQNTSGTFSGSLTFTGLLTDSIGPVREKRPQVVNSNTLVQATQSVIIANNSNTIYINIDNEGKFIFPANVGTTIDIFQYGSGQTAIRANDAAVTILSSNNWMNVAGQYLSASLIKVQSNTWILTGNLKA